MSIFGALKDQAAAASARALVNRKIASFGEVTTLHIDSGRRIIRVEVRLKGEVTPVVVEALSYELARDGGRAFVTPGGIRASREWLEIILNEYVTGHKFEVPPAVAGCL